ncbi:MAG: 30S ribosomal protein S6 [Actinomycetes bacterium]
MSTRHYEVMVILDPELEERTVAPSLDAFLNVVKVDGGTVDKVDIWGRRRLAYEIDKRTEGIYAVLDISCTPAAVAELDRQLNLNDAVLRTKVHRPAVVKPAVVKPVFEKPAAETPAVETPAVVKAEA